MRRARVGERFEQRRGSQLPEQVKRGRATYTYVNDGSLEELEGWVAALVEELGGC